MVESWLGVGNVLVELACARIAADFSLRSHPFFAGAVLTRIVPDSSSVNGDVDGPYCAHVDRARVATDDFAAVLYLSTQNEDFRGGGIAFMDSDEDLWVAPRRGRLVAFTAGPENLHRVGRVSQGVRFALVSQRIMETLLS